MPMASMITTQIAETAARISAVGFPDFLNRWIGMTPERLAEHEDAKRQIAQHQQGQFSMTTAIGPKDRALQTARVESPEKASPTPNGQDKPDTSRRAHSPAKKVHPADAANLAAVATAKSFTVDIFHDGEHQKQEGLPSIAAARTQGALMRSELGASRDFIVYAVLEDGRSFPVPRDYQVPATQETTMQPKTKTAAPAKPKASTERRKPGTRKGAPAKAAKANGKSKTDIALEMLTKGATRKAIAEATNWPTIDLKQIAKRHDKKLIEKDGVYSLKA